MTRFKEAFKKYQDLLNIMREDIAFCDENNDISVNRKRNDVFIIVYDNLVNDMSLEWCTHKQFKLCIDESKKREGFRPEKASEAFCSMERYIICIILMPWKREYKRIKKYSGFYQNAIENNLSGAEAILNLAGFIELELGVLSLSKAPKIEELKYIAFECFVSSVVFKITAESLEKAKLSRESKLNLIYGDARVPDSNIGKYNAVPSTNVFDCAKASVPVEKLNDKPNIDKSNTINIDRTSTEHHRTRLIEHLRQAQKLASPEIVSTDFPFMDEVMKQSVEYEVGTLEDHLKASLQVVEDNENTPTAYVEPVPRSISASQEWDFVHEGLKQKFGDQYFEGPRKDILDSNEKDVIGEKIVKQKPELRPVKFGDDPWSGRINKLAENPISAYDSAYQSGIHAQFPPSIPSDKQFLSRSSTNNRNYGTDVVMKKSNLTNQDALHSRTAPIMRRSAPVKHDIDEPLSRQMAGLQIGKGNTQGVETLKRELNDLSKEPIVGKSIGLNKVPVSSMITSTGQSSGLGGSISSRGRGVGQSSISARNDFDGINTIPTQITDRWHCSSCTYVNDACSNVCQVCLRTRDSNIDTDSPSVGSTCKVCEKCTFENICSSKHCEACGNLLRGSQTVV